MTCHLCVDAKSEPTSNRFTAHCDSCQARTIALVGEREALLQEPLAPAEQQVLERLFGAAWREHVQSVRDWISAIRRKEAADAAASA